MDYSFDNRLLNQLIILDHDNFVDDLLRFNGIYYRYQQDNHAKLHIGQTIKILSVTGNIISIQTVS